MEKEAAAERNSRECSHLGKEFFCIFHRFLPENADIRCRLVFSRHKTYYIN